MLIPVEKRRAAEWLECAHWHPWQVPAHMSTFYPADDARDLARKLRAEADAWESCEYCHGEGDVFGHAEDCRDELCALNGDMHSCVGRVLPCNCRPLPPGPEA